MPAGTDGAAATAVLVVLQHVGARGTAAAGLARFATVAAAHEIAISRVAAPTGVIAEPRAVPAGGAWVASPLAGRPRRPGGTCLRGGHTQRPHREQDRDQPEDTSAWHGFLLLRCWSPQGALPAVAEGRRGE